MTRSPLQARPLLLLQAARRNLHRPYHAPTSLSAINPCQMTVVPLLSMNTSHLPHCRAVSQRAVVAGASRASIDWRARSRGESQRIGTVRGCHCIAHPCLPSSERATAPRNWHATAATVAWTKMVAAIPPPKCQASLLGHFHRFRRLTWTYWLNRRAGAEEP